MIEVIYDFLHHLIFGSDLPYVKKALDPLTLSLILGGTKALTDVGQGIATSGRARRQREEGEKIAEQALQRLQGLDFETGPKLGVTQDTRDLAELQMRQSAEAMQNLRDQNLALSQQAIASGVMDPTRASQSIANIAPALSRQLGQSELSAAMQSTAAKQNLANLAEGYARANVLREQGVMDMNVQADRSLQERIRREGAQAAGLGFAAEGQAVGQMINAPAAGIDTGLAAFNLAQGLNPDGSNRDNSVNSGGVKRNIDGTLDFDGNPYNSRAKGGALSNQIYITGGEFNHDTNKKALIDEETGEKEAELTGDEAVLNPEQTDNTMQAFKILKDAIAKMENPPEELLAALEKMSHFDEPQFQVPQMEIEIA